MNISNLVLLLGSIITAISIVSCGNANLANPNCYNLNSLINHGIQCDLPQGVIRDYAIRLADKCFSDNFQDDLNGLTVCDAIRRNYGQLHH